MGKNGKIAGLIAAVVLLLSGLPVQAAANTLHELTVTVSLNEDGSADIVEIWDITATEGTEVYKEMNRMSGSEITGFTVTEDDVLFETLESWNINASREQKAQKAGIVKDGSDYELCFGIGEYGRHTFTMNYRIENFVFKYSDMYGMNTQLVGVEMNTKPEKVKVQVFGDLLTADTEIYAFGFEGDIYLFEDGENYYIEATNQQGDEDYGRVNYVNILAGFAGAEYSSGNGKYSSRSFTDIVDEAKEGSDYRNNSSTDYGQNRNVLWIVMRFFTSSGLLVFTIVALILLRKLRGRKGPKYYSKADIAVPSASEVNYFRDIPCNKDIYFFYYIARKSAAVDQSTAQSGLITGILLNWIREKRVEFVKREKRVLFSKKDTFQIHFLNGRGFQSPMENTLYSFFKQAAGADEILENKEFEKWCKNNYTRMEGWFSSIDSAVEHQLKNQGYLERIEITEKVLFVFKRKRFKKVYLEPFHEEVIRVIGFKKFLKEFGSLGEKQVKEVALWEDYLIFASVLGLADKVEKEIGRLYPEFVEQSYIDVTYTTIATQAFAARGVSRMEAARRAADAAEASRSSGGGGSSSYSGGGSSYSGGGGGGVR